MYELVCFEALSRQLVQCNCRDPKESSRTFGLYFAAERGH